MPVCHEVVYMAHLVMNDAKVALVPLETHQNSGRCRYGTVSFGREGPGNVSRPSSLHVFFTFGQQDQDQDIGTLLLACYFGTFLSFFLFYSAIGMIWWKVGALHVPKNWAHRHLYYLVRTFSVF